VFAFTMIFAGRIQDKLSPRITAMIGGVLTGVGLIAISQSTELFNWVIGFGVLMGMGLGFGYASATPPAIKWFPPQKTGLIAGLVVAGFGLASVYIAPLARFLIGAFGLSQSMMILGIAFLFVVVLLAQLLVNPPAGYVPESAPAKTGKPAKKLSRGLEFNPGQMLRTGAFYKLWFMYFVGAGAGLIIIGSVAGMAKESMGDLSWVVVALMAVGNAGGRIVAGIVSDKIGRPQTLMIMLCLQAAIIFSLLFIGSDQAFLLLLAATLIGFNYGTNLSLFPSASKDYFGLKNFGVNYGLLFTAWGVGGFILPRIAQSIVATTGTANTAYILSTTLLLVAAITTLLTTAPEDLPAPRPAATGFHLGPYGYSPMFVPVADPEKAEEAARVAREKYEKTGSHLDVFHYNPVFVPVQPAPAAAATSANSAETNNDSNDKE
jgi:MFS family permease